MTSHLARLSGLAAVYLAVACSGGGGGGGGGDGRHTLAVTMGGASTGGRVTSTPAGIDCPGTCTAGYDAGTAVTLAEVPAAGHVFTGWSGGCSGSGACAVTMSADRAVTAGFDGPTDVTVATPYGVGGFPLSLLPGEGATVPVATALARGAPGQVVLSLNGLPAGVTASFAPASVPAGGSSTLTVNVAAGAAVTATPASASLVATTAFGTRSASLPVEIRSPAALGTVTAIAFEADGQVAPATALVAEAVPGFPVGRLVRVDLATRRALRTILAGVNSATGPLLLGAPRGLALNNPTTTALVASSLGLTKVDVATGQAALLAPSTRGLNGVAWESTASALVTECGAVAGCTAGRVSRIDLSSGALTPVTAATLNDPAQIIGQGAYYVAERGGGRVLAVYVDGTSTVVAEGLDHPTGLMGTFGGSVLVTTAGGGIVAVGPYGGVMPFLDLPGAGAGAIAASPWSHQEALVATRDPDRLLRLRLTFREPIVLGPAPGEPALVAPRAFASLSSAFDLAIADCGPGGEAGCALTGRVVRISAGKVTPMATGLADPRGITLGPDMGGSFPLLVTEHAAGRLLRIDPDTKAVKVVATGLPSPWGVAVEDPMARLALVAGSNGVYRVALDSGAVTKVSGLTPTCGAANHGRGIDLVVPGKAVVAEACPPQVTEVDLATGELTPLPLGVADPRSVRAYNDAFVTDAGQGGRVFAASNALTYLAGLGSVVDAHAMGSGNFAWLDASAVAYEATGFDTQLVAQKLEKPSGLALEPDGSTALLVDCGGSAACDGTGRLLSLDLGTNALAEVYRGLAAPAAVAREGSLKVLVADCATAATCATTGRLSRVEGGGRTTVAGGLADPAWVAIEPSGTSALVAERAAGKITRVDLASGAKTPVASGLAHPRQIVIEGGGLTALLAEDGRISRLTLATGVAVPVVLWDLERFTLVAGQPFAGMLPRRDAPGLAQFIATADLTTGEVDVWGVPLTDAPDTTIWVPNLGRVFYTERRSGTGAVHSFYPF